MFAKTRKRSGSGGRVGLRHLARALQHKVDVKSFARCRGCMRRLMPRALPRQTPRLLQPEVGEQLGSLPPALCLPWSRNLPAKPASNQKAQHSTSRETANQKWDSSPRTSSRLSGPMAARAAAGL